MMIEAKKLDSPLQDAALAQGINYCLVEGTPYFAVTDGRRWEVYEPHRPVPLAEKRVEDFDLASSSPTEAALKSLILWRPNVEAGELTVAPFPVFGKEAMSPPTTEQPSHVEGNSNSGVASQWLPLSQLNPKPYDKPPKFLRLPDGSEVPINHWVDLAIQVTAWLQASGTLTAQQCPITRASKHLVNVSPIHANGKPFTVHRHVGSLHLEVNYNAKNQCQNARLILQHVGDNPENYQVRI